VGTEPFHQSEAVQLEHPLGSTGVGVEVKLVDLRSGEDSVFVKLDQDLEVPSGESMRVAGDQRSRS
jgi:hypothetical protein